MTTIPTVTLNTGDKMPVFGLGTWQSKPGEVKSACYEAIKCGYKHIDAAHVYMNEAEVGEGIALAISEGFIKREELFVTSKLWNTDHAAADVEPACQLTLKHLGLDQLDLYLIHWPVSIRQGAAFPLTADDLIEVPIKETWQAMEALVEKGLVKAIGVSNFSIRRIEEVLSFAKIKPAMNQVECHPYLNQSKLIDFCHKQNIFVTAYSPLGSPDRPSAGAKNQPKPLMEDETLKAIADKHKVSVAQVLIKFQIQYGNIVIPKSVNAGRIKANLESLQVQLSDEDMKAIKSMNFDCRYIDGSFFVPEGSKGPIKTVEQLWN